MPYLGLQQEAEALAAAPEIEAALEGLEDAAAVAYCQTMLGRILLANTALGDDPSGAIAPLQAALAYYQRAPDPLLQCPDVIGGSELPTVKPDRKRNSTT